MSKQWILGWFLRFLEMGLGINKAIDQHDVHCPPQQLFHGRTKSSVGWHWNSLWGMSSFSHLFYFWWGLSASLPAQNTVQVFWCHSREILALKIPLVPTIYNMHTCSHHKRNCTLDHIWMNSTEVQNPQRKLDDKCLCLSNVFGSVLACMCKVCSRVSEALLLTLRALSLTKL